jgi:hypothetical protein
MEGDLLDVAMGMEDFTQPMEVVVPASAYCLKSSGNAELFRKYTEHLDPEFQHSWCCFLSRRLSTGLC